MTHHVIYVPGLGDFKPRGQQFVPWYWQLYGIRGHYVPMLWREGRFAPKLERLLAKIDELSANGDPVSLVGTSAGASVVLLALAARQDKIAGVVCICGKINHPETIRPAYFVENPAFKESLAELQKTLPALGPEARKRIMSIHPLSDNSVPPADTIIPGAKEVTQHSKGHAFSIFVALLFSAPAMMRFLKSQA